MRPTKHLTYNVTVLITWHLLTLHVPVSCICRPKLGHHWICRCPELFRRGAGWKVLHNFFHVSTVINILAFYWLNRVVPNDWSYIAKLPGQSVISSPFELGDTSWPYGNCGTKIKGMERYTSFFCAFAAIIVVLTRAGKLRQMYRLVILTHWGRATHICVSKLTIIGSDNGLSPGRMEYCWFEPWEHTSVKS